MSEPASLSKPNRAIIFVDGSNWFHALRDAGVQAQGQLDYVRVAEKLVGSRTFVEMRWYVGQLTQAGSTYLYEEQRRFFARYTARDPKLKVFYGRMEERSTNNEAAKDLLEYMAGLAQRKLRIDSTVFRELVALGEKHRKATLWIEKAVDVTLAVDLVVMAERDAYDTAYVLSRDGDFTHAVQFARGKGKRVFAVSNERSSQLGNAVDAFITVDASWFEGCFLQAPERTSNAPARPSQRTPSTPEVIKKRR